MESKEAANDITIALNIGKDWKFLARMLNFKEAELQEIENNESLIRDRAFTMLKCYEEKHNPENRKYLTLALIHMKRMDLLIPKTKNEMV